MKKVVLPLVMLVIGLVTGYFFGKKEIYNNYFTNKDGKIVKPQPIAFESVDLTKRPIDPDVAKRLIQKFRDWNDKKNPFPFKGDHGVNLKGFFVPKTDIDKIFLGHDNSAGLSFFIAKHPDHENEDKQIFTFIFMRADDIISSISNSKQQNPPPTYHNTYETFDYVIPCPDKCGDFY